MNKNEREIYEAYAFEYEYYRLQYMLLCKLLDETRVKQIIKERGWKKVYLYGGTYLEKQFEKAVSDIVDVIHLVNEEQSELETFHSIDLPDTKILKDVSPVSPIIITDIKEAESIKEKITVFVDSENIYYINEII